MCLCTALGVGSSRLFSDLFLSRCWPGRSSWSSCSRLGRRGFPGWRCCRSGRRRGASRWSSSCRGSGGPQTCPPVGLRCGWSRRGPRCSCGRSAESRSWWAWSRRGRPAEPPAARPTRRSGYACGASRGRWPSSSGFSSPYARWSRSARARAASFSAAAQAPGRALDSAGCCGTPRCRSAGRSRSCCCRCRSRPSPCRSVERESSALGTAGRSACSVRMWCQQVSRDARTELTWSQKCRGSTGRWHAPLSVCLLFISSYEPVSLAHDRPLPGYILDPGNPPPCGRSAPCLETSSFT